MDGHLKIARSGFSLVGTVVLLIGLLAPQAANAYGEDTFVDPISPTPDSTTVIQPTCTGDIEFVATLTRNLTGPAPVTYSVAKHQNVDAGTGLLTAPREAAGSLRAAGSPQVDPPFTYSYRATDRWLLGCRAGTYYLQFAYRGACGQPDPYATYCTSRLYRFTITEPTPPPPPAPPAAPPPVVVPPPPPPPHLALTLTIANARAQIRSAIRTRTKRTARNLRGRICKRVDATTVRCTAKWHDRAYLWAGTWTIRKANSKTVASFAGARTTRKCSRRCLRKVSL